MKIFTELAQFKNMMSKLRLSITEASTKTTIQTPKKSSGLEPTSIPQSIDHFKPEWSRTRTSIYS